MSESQLVLGAFQPDWEDLDELASLLEGQIAPADGVLLTALRVQCELGLVTLQRPSDFHACPFWTRFVAVKFPCF